MTRRRWNWALFLIVMAVFSGGFGVFKAFQWGCHSEYRQGKVIKLEWRHRTNMRWRRIFRDGDWGEAPMRAGYYREPTFKHACFSKFSHMQCSGGKTNICFPVHHTWCDYNYFEWPVMYFKEIEGEGHVVTWETFGEELDDDHRETREGWYAITFTNTEDVWRYTTRDGSTYVKFEVGDLWELEFPNIGNMHPTKKTVLEAP